MSRECGCIARGPRRARIYIRAAVQGVALALIPPCARGGLSFDSSTSSVELVHDPDRSSSSVLPYVRSLTLVPKAADVPVPPAYQLRRTFTSEAASSQAFGSIGHVTNATTGTFVLSPGTGVTQNDPGDAEYPGASSLKFKVDLLWSATSGGFGPLATGYGSVNVGGVVGDGGSARFVTNLTFTDPVTGRRLRPDWVEDASFRTPGGFSRTFTTSAVLNADVPGQFGVLAAGQQMRIRGTIEFRSSNAVTPTRIAPLELELGGAPPTGRWSGAVNGGNWTESANWFDSGQPQNPGLPRVPNAPGERAKFMEAISPTDVEINETITLGTLDIDSGLTYRCVDDPERDPETTPIQQVIFESPGDRSVINVRRGDHSIDVPVSFRSPLDINVERNSTMSFNYDLRGSDTIRKFGSGSLSLPEGLDAGGLEVYEGSVFVTSRFQNPGRMRVLGGTLGFQSEPSLSIGDRIEVEAGGTLSLSSVNARDVITVRQFGMLSASPSTMRSLTVGGNLLLESGAILQGFGPDFPQNLGSTPRYILGHSFIDFHTVGSASGTAFRGIGMGDDAFSDHRVFGRSGQVVGIAGFGDVVATGKVPVEVESEITGSAGSTLAKRGPGTVVLFASNTLLGVTNVFEGELAVEGALPGAVTVSSLGTLGGRGSVGDVTVLDRGRLRPGAFARYSNPEPNPTPLPALVSLTVDDLTLNETSVLDLDVGAPGESDRIRANGNVTIDGLLDLAFIDGAAPGEYSIIQYEGQAFDRRLEIGRAPASLAYETRLQPRAAGGGEVILRADFPHWRLPRNGSWSDPARWFGGKIPDRPGAVAHFRLVALGGDEAQIQMDTARTLGELTFDVPGSVRLLGAAGIALQLDNLGSGADVVVKSGNHSVEVPVQLADDGYIDVTDGASLSLQSVASDSPAVELTKSGGGRLSIQEQLTLPAASLIDVRKGVMEAGRIAGGVLSVRKGGSVKIKVGSGLGASVFERLELDRANGAWLGTLDVTDNEIIIKGTAATREALLAQVVDQVKSGRNTGTAGRWSGNGITSSIASQNMLTGLVAVLNPGLATFGGEAASADDVLVKYTYNGDANLDGRVNADDYFRIDQNFLAQPQDPTYDQGDFNYDGTINADDYFLIDQAFIGQGQPIGGGTAALAAAAVPEPSAAGLALAAGLLLQQRRRRASREG